VSDPSADGFEVRRRGSHIVMQRRTDAGSVTVPTRNGSERDGVRSWQVLNDHSPWWLCLMLDEHSDRELTVIGNPR
jgi:hypothetical protein